MYIFLSLQFAGTGTFGQVRLCRHNVDGNYYALKVTIYPKMYMIFTNNGADDAEFFIGKGNGGNEMAFFDVQILRKTQIIRLRQFEHVMSEKSLLSEIQHPFVVNLITTFKDKYYLYLLMDYVPGGELFTHLRRVNRFSEPTSKFYAASIVLAFQYLHSKDIIYRDLKPENLLLDRFLLLSRNCKPQ